MIIPNVTGRFPFDVVPLVVITFDPVLTKPFGSTLDVMSPTWINTGAGSDFTDLLDTSTDPLITSGLPDSEEVVTDNCGNRVSAASLIGVVTSLVWSIESTPSFVVDVVLDASPFSMVVDDFCLFLFFFFRLFAVAN